MSARPLLLQEIRERRTTLRSRPTTVNLELTGRCNAPRLACLHCTGRNSRGYREKPDLAHDQLQRFWPYLAGAERVNDNSFGEPLLHPGFEAFVDRLSAAGVRFGFTTNGLLLSDRCARFLVERAEAVTFVVSIDAARPETYLWLHGVPLPPLLRNLERFAVRNARVRPGRPPEVVLSFIVMRSNQDEVPEFLHLAKALGVRFVLLRHLFDMGAGSYARSRLGRQFVYEHERLTLADHRAVAARVRALGGLEGLEIHFTWEADSAFMAECAEAGTGLRCLFPWKFLAIRPIHDEYSPCPFLKTSIAAPSRTDPEQVWNGEALVDMRSALYDRRLPAVCLEFGVCPLVLAHEAATRRAR